MILVSESVWIEPSFSRTKPRTVYMVGRPARSMSNLRSIAAWNSGPRNSSISAWKWPWIESSAGGCEPGPGTSG